MKRWIRTIALVLALGAGSAHADWIFIGDSADGELRLLGEKGSVKVEKNRHDVWVVLGNFAFFDSGSGVMRDTQEAAIDTASCKASGGEMVYDLGGGRTKTVFWAAGGSRMYDMLGRALCTEFDVWAEANREEEVVKRPVVKSSI